MHHGEDFFVSINISAQQLLSEDITQTFKSAILESGIDAGAIHIELQESKLLASEELIVACRALGVSLTLDDFGNGYSSLSYLRRLPIRSLKIGQSFVQHLNDGGTEMLIIEAIIKLGHALDLAVIAEGVEQEAQLEHLKQLGCDYGQGYLWARPMAVADFEAWWENHWVRN